MVLSLHDMAPSKVMSKTINKKRPDKIYKSYCFFFVSSKLINSVPECCRKNGKIQSNRYYGDLTIKIESFSLGRSFVHCQIENI